MRRSHQQHLQDRQSIQASEGVSLLLLQRLCQWGRIVDGMEQYPLQLELGGDCFGFEIEMPLYVMSDDNSLVNENGYAVACVEDRDGCHRYYYVDSIGNRINLAG